MQISSATTSPYTSINDATTPRSSNNVDTDMTASASASASASAEAPSSVKQFACGALGLDNPGTQASDANQFYTAGKWVAAAVTIGKIVSLFV